MSVTNPAESAKAGAGADELGRGRVRRAVRTVLVTLVVLVMVVISGLYLTSERLGEQVHRYGGVFAGLDDRTRPPATAATTFLLVGSDALAPVPQAPSGDESGVPRNDVIMLISVDPEFSSATVVSVPSESWVNVPGRGMDKLNASFSVGGPSLLVRTVETLTHIRIDHFAAIDFAGFQALTDLAGGIDVDITEGLPAGPVTFHTGPNHLGGAQVLDYLRRRGNQPGGDLGRVRRQQNALRALLIKTRTDDLLNSPVRDYEFLETLTQWMGVDDGLTNGDLRTLVWRLRKLDPRDIIFLTAPVAGSGSESGRTPVRLDPVRNAELWQAVADGDPGRYVRKYPADSLGGASR